MFSHRITRSVAIGATAIVIGGGAYSILSATASTGSGTGTTAAPISARSAQRVLGGGGNARSGPAAGGSVGKVSGVSTSVFALLTSAGEKVTVKETPSTRYAAGAHAASASAVAKGKTALVLGTTNSTTITATLVIVQPTNSGSKTSSKVIPFKPGTPSTSKQVGQIPINYRQGFGSVVSGAPANKATRAALAAYPGGIVDRVVKLSNGEYEAHNIGVNWPHHIFVNQGFKVVGAD
jgi:hypothetical protein